VCGWRFADDGGRFSVFGGGLLGWKARACTCRLNSLRGVRAGREVRNGSHHAGEVIWRRRDREWQRTWVGMGPGLGSLPAPEQGDEGEWDAYTSAYWLGRRRIRRAGICFRGSGVSGGVDMRRKTASDYLLARGAGCGRRGFRKECGDGVASQPSVKHGTELRT